MRIFGRDDARLFLGLIMALVVVFARPIGRLLDIARDVERTYGLSLIPGLIILVVVFLYHVQEKRQSIKAEAAAASAAARHAEQRTRELERLVGFSHALTTQTRDIETVRDVLLQQLSPLAGDHTVWMLIRSGGHWEALLGPTTELHHDAIAFHERLADQAIKKGQAGVGGKGICVEDHVCFPLSVGGEFVGVLGVPVVPEPLTDAQLRMLEAASAIIAASVGNAQLFRELRDNSLRDGMTGLFNRAHGLEQIEFELRRARRSTMPLSLIMFDIDHFKEVNDRFGHLCGDTVISTIGRRLKQVLRGSDMKCRYGGEEFLVLLPETTLEGARQVAENLRQEIATIPVPWERESISITASFGLASAEPGEVDPTRLIARTDAALYRAKHEGRNCVRISDESVLV